MCTIIAHFLRMLLVTEWRAVGEGMIGYEKILRSTVTIVLTTTDDRVGHHHHHPSMIREHRHAIATNRDKA